MEEAIMRCVTRGNSTPNGKPRIYFTCHPDDFDKYFQKVCDDIFKSHNPAIYYTSDMTATFDGKNKEADLGRSNLFVIPITYKLLTTKNRAMDHDFRYAKENHIPVLPLMMESGLDEIYSKADKFSELQYLNPFSTNHTEISYEEKLKKFLNVVLISEELIERVRGAFDAYIFLSYRKKDRAYANKLIKLIHNNPEYRDIAIWFDEFLSPGESFKENIEKILKDSEMFALLVTPNLLEEPEGKPNFVMAKEYPAALASGKKILPTEMEETDKEELSRKFNQIPPCVKPETEFEELKAQLAETLTMAAKTKNDNDPEHNFLIGLAYLEGIDVEVDKERGLELITSAARNNLPEAMIMLRDMYSEKIGPNKNLRRATSWAEGVYRYYSRNYGEYHRDTLISLNIYAELCREIEEHDFAFKLSEKAYALCGKVFGEEHPETLNSLNVLAMSSEKVKTFEESVALCEKAYTLCSNALGEEHPVTMTAINNYATLCYNHKKYKKALKLFEKAYRLRCVALGEDHPETLRSMDSFADTYTKIRKHKKALLLREKEYEFYCKILGEVHPDTLTKLHNLALAYGKAGKKTKAVKIFEKAYNLRASHLGEDDHDTISSLLELSTAHSKIRNYVKAAKLLLKCELDSKPLLHVRGIPETLDNSVLQSEDRARLKSLLNLADSYEDKGEKAKVLETYEKAYEMCCDFIGEDKMLSQSFHAILVLICWKNHMYIKAYKYHWASYRGYFKIMKSLIKDLRDDLKGKSKKKQ